MELQKVKEILNLKGLMQDGLFALGSIPGKSAKDLGHAFGAVWAGNIPKFYAITFFEGELIITPITDKEVLIEELIRIKKTDVDSIIVKSGLIGMSLQITKDNAKKVYNIEKSGDIQEIVKRVNS